MNNIYKYHHTIVDIDEKDEIVLLKCKVTIKKFDGIRGFWSNINGKLKYNETYRDEEFVYYEVKLPLNSDRTNEPEKFYTLLKNNKKERVWKPDSKLKKEKLPQGYFFNNRYLNFTYSSEPASQIVTYTPVLKQISSFSDNKLLIEGYIFLPSDIIYEINKFKMRFIKFREEEISYTFDLNLSTPKEDEIFNRFSVKEYQNFNNADVLFFSVEIPLSQIANNYSFFNFYITYEERDRLLQNYYASMTKKEQIFTYPLNDKDDISILIFYYDDIAKVWRLDIYHMTQEEYMKLQKLKSQKKRDNNIWLIGEYTISARDNGMHLYNYMVKYHKEVECYYVVEKNSQDLHNLDPSRIVEYGSYKHFKIASKAKVLVFTHMPNYLVPKINSITNYKNKYKQYFKFFLQHGVIGTTTSMKMVEKIKRKYDLFNVSSDFERDIIIKHLGYNEKEVSVNGLPRWDRLYREKKYFSRILIMPTWRNDLANVDDELFVQSEYFKFWNGLLNHKDFKNYIEENNIKVDFFLHIALNRFVKHFNVDNQYISFKNDENIQDLLLNCGMLITDYSSVSFDALFQNKPVIYAPFDFEHMIALRGGGEQYIDYEKDLAGPICKTAEEVVRSIIDIAEAGWCIDEKYQAKRLKWFKYIDANNSQRVYSSVYNAVSKQDSFSYRIIKMIKKIKRKILDTYL